MSVKAPNQGFKRGGGRREDGRVGWWWGVCVSFTADVREGLTRKGG